MEPVNTAVVGLGYWGPNLVRNIAALKETRLHTICDQDDKRLAEFARQYPEAKTTPSFDSVLKDPDVEAVVLATPSFTHFELAREALRSGKHVMVEKPLAQTSKECAELISLAEEGDRTLMVGHIFLFNAAD